MNKLIIVCFCISISGGIASAQKHIPWKLDNAQERIEKYRKAKTEIIAVLPNGILLPKGSAVEVRLINHAFNFGISLTQMHAILNDSFRDNLLNYVDHLFNYNTVGFYWSANEKQKGKWKLSEPYQFGLDWAVSKGKTVRGHPLMWHNSSPRWINSETRDTSEIHQDILIHVRRLLRNYPEINEWDIYNEAPSITEIRGYVGQNHGVARWMDDQGGQGPVISLLADEMQKIRPEADILINHFQHEHKSYHDLIKYCLQNNIPIKSIGIQAHMQEKNGVWSEKEMWELMEDYGQYGIPIDFTEVTICSCELVEDWRGMSDWQDSLKKARRNGDPIPERKTSSKYNKYQAEYARDFYTLAFSHPSIDTIVLWALSDKGSWRNFPAGVFDDKGRPKLIYKTLNDLIHKKWNTHVKGKIRENGKVPLHGFLGEYEITTTYEGKTHKGYFSLNKDQGDSVEVFLQ